MLSAFLGREPDNAAFLSSASSDLQVPDPRADDHLCIAGRLDDDRWWPRGRLWHRGNRFRLPDVSIQAVVIAFWGWLAQW